MTTTVKLGQYIYSCQPRWGFGRPTHPLLTRRIESAHGAIARNLGRFAELAARLGAIALEAPDDSPEPRWMNPWFTGLDAVALYGFLARFSPRTMIEIGSGNSTKFARRAIADFALPTRLVSIDPQPRAEIDALCDEVLRVPAESVGPDVFARLQPGDILFIDSSHRSLENSDVTALFLEVLPSLKPGVIVHVHDVYLPYDYPPHAEGLLYNEQYLLAAFLLANDKWLEPIMPCFHVSQDATLAASLNPIWQALGTNAFPAPSASFWFKVQKQR